ncbi:MAG: RidA family protein [Gemmatimonadales bacterium]|nr:RidA family protein [Gemmatimonadales bacterium]
MPIGVVATDAAPKAIGPYSQALTYGDLVFTAGQIALDPATMEVVAGGIGEQTERVMQNLEGLLKASGSDLSRVLKTTVFLQSMSDFVAMNAVYARYFGEHRPARSTVAAAGLPRNVLVEIEAVAVRSAG